MGKPTISMAIFNSNVSWWFPHVVHPQPVTWGGGYHSLAVGLRWRSNCFDPEKSVCSFGNSLNEVVTSTKKRQSLLVDIFWYIYILYYLLGLTFIKSLISFGLTLLKKTCWGRIWYVLDRLLTGWCLFCHQVGSIFRVPNLDLIAICENSCMGKFHDMVTFCRLPIKVAKEIQRFFGSATNLLWIVLRILLSPLHSKRSEKTWRIYPLVI